MIGWVSATYASPGAAGCRSTEKKKKQINEKSKPSHELDCQGLGANRGMAGWGKATIAIVSYDITAQQQKIRFYISRSGLGRKRDGLMGFLLDILRYMYTQAVCSGDFPTLV